MAGRSTIRPRAGATGALWWAATLLAGAGCLSDDASRPPLINDASPDWVAVVVRDPTRFASLLESTNRDGWIALHANQLPAAREAFSGDAPATRRARARAEWDLALLYSDLTRASDAAMYLFLERWSERELPVTDGLTTVSTAWQQCDGPAAALKAFPDVDAATLPAVFSARLPDDPDSPQVAALAARRALADGARAGDVTALVRAATEPLVSERVTSESGEEFVRAFYDPCLFRTLDEVWMARAEQTVALDAWQGVASSWASADAGLEGLLFAGWLTTGDLVAEIPAAAHPGTVGATMPSLAILGLDPKQSLVDDVDTARDEVRILDAALETRRGAMLGSADDDGRALLTDLRLQHRFRQEFLVARARKSLLENRPRQARAYLELARDIGERQVGASNSPSVLALYAEAQIRLGHTREALDVLHILTDAHPEVTGLKELAGDLAVLQGLDRQGDSKEN